MIIFISTDQSHGSVTLYIVKYVHKINTQIRIIMSKLLSFLIVDILSKYYP